MTSGGGTRPRSVLLVSCYDLGRQPFAVASAAAWLERAGHRVACLDLAVQPLDDAEDSLAGADVVAFSVPMHTATRIALAAARAVRQRAPRARLVAFGLYAPLNEEVFRAAGVSAILGGEVEQALLRAVEADATVASGEPGASVVLEPLALGVPKRDALPPLERYARLSVPGGSPRLVGATEATRGCRHRCRHCPVVPVYDGRVFVVPKEVVLEDIRRQVAAGAGHVTFGDPDFFNGPGHVLPIVEALHDEHPDLTYDVTIKVEHLLRHRRHLPALARTGCAFVTSAVESIDDAVLARLDKGHTRADFREAVHVAGEAGLPLSPTFIPFNPWTTLEGYLELLGEIDGLGLVGHVAPIQLAIRLLVTSGSRLLELEEIRALAGPFDPASLAHPWEHRDPRVDELQREVRELVARAGRAEHAGGTGPPGHREALFAAIRARAREALDLVPAGPVTTATAVPRRAPIPYLTEPWYC